MKKIKEELELIDRFYDIEGEYAIIDLYFDTFSELIDAYIGDDNVEMFNNLFFDKLDDAFKIIPVHYKLKIKINIKELSGYTIDEADTIIRSNIQLHVHRYRIENRRRKRKFGFLFAGGAFGLLLSYTLSQNYSIILLNDVLNIASTLLIWESSHAYIIDNSDYRKKVYQYIHRIHSISTIHKEENHNVKNKEDKTI